jgi:uncharacterized membrane protein
VRLLKHPEARFAVSVGAGVAASLLGSPLGRAEGALIGIAVAGVCFVVLGWLVLRRLDPAVNAVTEDPSRTVEEGLVVGVALASLGGIAAFLIAGGSSAPTWAAAVAVLGVAMSWASLHLMYAARYAKLYYAKDAEGAPRKGIEFGGDEPLSYLDFLYFSYNLGMTYQVSDTDVTRSEIRTVVLFHCLLSYVFGTAILATTINLVLGALTG